MAGTTGKLLTLEDSLIEFLISEHLKTARSKDEVNAHKYKGLKIVIDMMSKRKSPFFSVQIGIFEATFEIATGIKLDGSLGGTDEALVAKWLELGANRATMQYVWQGGFSVVGGKGKLEPFGITDD